MNALRIHRRAELIKFSQTDGRAAASSHDERCETSKLSGNQKRLNLAYKMLLGAVELVDPLERANWVEWR